MVKHSSTFSQQQVNFAGPSLFFHIKMQTIVLYSHYIIWLHNYYKSPATTTVESLIFMYVMWKRRKQSDINSTQCFKWY